MYIIDIDIILKTHNFPLSTIYNIHIQYNNLCIIYINCHNWN